MTAQRVIVNLAPYRELSPNWSGYPKGWKARDTPFGTKQHWRAIAEAKRRYKELVYRQAAEQLCGAIDLSGRRVLVRVRVGWPKGHKKMDHSNCAASLKAAVDGLTLAGLWKDDNLVNVIVTEQLNYGEQDAATRGLFPQGWVTMDFDCEVTV